MTTLHDTLKSEMIKALKAREEVRLTTLRGIISAVTNELVTLKRKPNEILEDDGVLSVIKRAVKQRKDSIEQFEKGGRQDLADKEKEEMAILETYLPAQASNEEIEAVVDKVLKDLGEVDPSKMGVVVGAAMKELKGNADGSVVKEIIAKKLS
ncbi:MAG: GatB/YqeY domain-containing protein [Candidatus Pacebacteria bacterium]|nr:GatB/YqeY domain-containing protein [Candidatus Paceibacterota bacterium]